MKAIHTEGLIEAGVDESGRGPGLGRVYTAAVIWPPGLTNCPLVRDSKTIRKGQMKEAYDYVIANALAYSIDYATEEEIERGILTANMASMHRSIHGLYRHPYMVAGNTIQNLLIDGNYFEPYMDPNGNFLPYVTVIKGDSAYYSIAAASILAKWTRDQYIEKLCDEYPDLQTRYGIRDNKGYLSAQAHKDGLATYGYSQFHRKTWKTFTDLPFNPVGSAALPPKPHIRIKPVIKKRLVVSAEN